VTLAPASVLAEDGDAESVKSGGGGGETTSVTRSEWVRVPLAPVIVSG
jgi:hypothetical protein